MSDGRADHTAAICAGIAVAAGALFFFVETSRAPKPDPPPPPSAKTQILLESSGILAPGGRAAGERDAAEWRPEAVFEGSGIVRIVFFHLNRTDRFTLALVPRDDAADCFARTSSFNIFTEAPAEGGRTDAAVESVTVRSVRCLEHADPGGFFSPGDIYRSPFRVAGELRRLERMEGRFLRLNDRSGPAGWFAPGERPVFGRTQLERAAWFLGLIILLSLPGLYRLRNEGLEGEIPAEGDMRLLNTTLLTAGLARFVSMQNHYNLLYREEEREMLPLCLEEGIGVLPWSPLASGLLAGTRATPADRASTPRAASDDYARQLYDHPTDADVVAATRSVAVARGVPMARVALAWLLSRPGVTAPIVGATKLAHLDEALAALDLSLTSEETGALEAPYSPHAVRGFAGPAPSAR